MTLRKLIDKLEDIACQNADNVVVLRSDNSGGCEAIYTVAILDAVETATGKHAVAVVIGEETEGLEVP